MLQPPAGPRKPNQESNCIAGLRDLLADGGFVAVGDFLGVLQAVSGFFMVGHSAFAFSDGELGFVVSGVEDV